MPSPSQQTAPRFWLRCEYSAGAHPGCFAPIRVAIKLLHCPEKPTLPELWRPQRGQRTAWIAAAGASGAVMDPISSVNFPLYASLPRRRTG